MKKKSTEKFYIEDFSPKKKEKIYFGYTFRLIGSILCLALFSIASVFLLYRSFGRNEIKNIRYQESGEEIVEKYGKEKEPLPENTPLPESEKLKVTANYKLMVNEKVNMEYTYFWKIETQEGKKKRTLKTWKEVRDTKTSAKSYSKKLTLEINWKEIEELLKEKKNKEQKTTVIFSLNIKKRLGKKDYPDEKIETRIALEDNKTENIPLKAEGRVPKKPSIFLKYPLLLILGILSGFSAAYFLTEILYLILPTIKEKSLYTRTVEKITKKYKEDIVKVDHPPTGKKKRRKVNHFESLLEGKKEEEKINYHIIQENRKCEFYRITKKEIIIYTIKESDLEQEKKSSRFAI